MNFDQILPKKPHAECKFCQVVHEAQCETLASVVAWLRERAECEDGYLVHRPEDWQALQKLSEDNKP